MSTTADKDYQAALAGAVEGVDQKKVSADVTIPMASPITHQRVMAPFKR